ncbi:Glutathione S-transferase-like protein ustS [Pseudocercospora fuligena]|uniref:Glutathione S-transferase-like protein ustS n=1 Tax=Pseudocercospora fuligena TaxID=685502 RepID=A0A8H6RAH7_9PEZI|nr:Glutathione S-transferase-like protein ustS [Pseudocercospora fuligena]
MTEIVLYDLPSKDPCTSWSGNALKTRIALNYKKIPYRTEWVPYIRLQQTLKNTGVKPNPEPNWSDYSVPTVRFPDGKVIMDSAQIAPELEKIQPNPPLHLDLKFHEKVGEAVGVMLNPLIAYFMPRVERDVIVEEDIEWFKADRTAKLGKPLTELEKEKGMGSAPWDAAKPGFQIIEKLLHEHKKDEGPFILGSEPTYGDLVLIAWTRMFKVVGDLAKDDSFDKFVDGAKGLRELYEAGEKWCESI